jgi:hypothetical protein
MSSFPSLLGSKVATGTMTSSHPSLLYFSYFNELVKSLIKNVIKWKNYMLSVSINVIKWGKLYIIPQISINVIKWKYIYYPLNSYKCYQCYEMEKYYIFSLKLV